jgi:hypothetical protein
VGCGDRAGDPHLPWAYEERQFRGVFAGRDAGPDGEFGWDGADLAVVTTSTAANASTIISSTATASKRERMFSC